MILKKYLEMNEVYKEISHSLSIYHQISIDFSQNKEMIKNWILLMTPISILFLCHFFVLNGIYQNYANEFVANISPDLLINDLGIKIHPLVYTYESTMDADTFQRIKQEKVDFYRKTLAELKQKVFKESQLVEKLFIGFGSSNDFLSYLSNQGCEIVCIKDDL